MTLMREQQRRNQLRKQLNNQNPAKPGSLFTKPVNPLFQISRPFAKLRFKHSKAVEHTAAALPLQLYPCWKLFIKRTHCHVINYRYLIPVYTLRYQSPRLRPLFLGELWPPPADSSFLTSCGQPCPGALHYQLSLHFCQR